MILCIRKYNHHSIGSIVATFKILSESAAMTSTIDSIHSKVMSGYSLNFEGNTIISHPSLIVDGKVYKATSVGYQ